MVRHLLFGYGVFVAPPILLLVAWVRVLRARTADRAVRAPWISLVVATSSDAYYWLSLASPSLFLGPNFSESRNDIVLVNILAALAVAVFLCFRKKVARWWLLAASLCLAVKWLFVAAISSAV